ncbi:hypothetical protein A2W14_02565 [Candidatus Gottesmanbacteria bacterium RBG_16_37_8]|uniref:Uncharacterized protein n=1 Tax=Candidatus Gottesmanbacteria bacterium RBG_16_37_8 TaxID=1798371 RepID=A0A1F5YPV7_9BACT|nr:MAG: hypothetical protein A2W14_02565 [Candidatus Gottesmanbacteria bacterium RBG_16_37_8]
MKIKRLVTAVIFLLLIGNYLKSVKAQDDTFGPICDDVTVTCAPTETPTETPTPTDLPPGFPSPTPSDTPTLTLTPTETPTPTPTLEPGVSPQESTPSGLPRAGNSSSLYLLTIISSSLVGFGFLNHLLFRFKK